MSQLLQGQVVIVTGAGSGIGRGILRAAIQAGATVIGFDINPDSAAIVALEGGDFMKVDVSDPVSFDAAIQSVRQQHGRLDGLVNNAGLTLVSPFLEADIAEWDRLWQVNQRSVLVGCQSAARIMVADGCAGSIVNVASNHSQASDKSYEAYAGTKGAILAMGRAMAWSLGSHNIRVNTLSPGLTLTEAVLEMAEAPETDRLFRSWHADNQVSSVDDIGRVAVYLLSAHSAALTGTELVADRGMSSRLVPIAD